MFNYVLIFTAVFATAVFTTPFAKRLSERLDLLARPGGRRKHEGDIPKLGGVPLMVSLMVGWVLTFLLFTPSSSSRTLLIGVMLGTIVVVIGGILDDRYDLSPLWQTAVHLVAALIAIQFDVFIELFTTPNALVPLWEGAPFRWLLSLEGQQVKMIRPFAILFTLFWVTGMINAVNWLDGLDGLASGVGAIAALVFAWHSYSLNAPLNNASIAAFPLALAAALFGFLLFNSAPARIYLGSAGAYLLGFQLATLSIVSPAKIMTALLVLALPIIDTAWRIFDRVRQGRSPFDGDRGHLHHLLFDRGVNVRIIVGGYYLFTIVFGVAVLLLPTPGLKVATLLGLGTAVLLLLIWLSSRKPIEM